MNFQDYVGKPVILITNFVDDPKTIFGIRDEHKEIEIFSLPNSTYVCARKLRKDDIKDEDFLAWLYAMWPDENKLVTYLTTIRKFEDGDQTQISKSDKGL